MAPVGHMPRLLTREGTHNFHRLGNRTSYTQARQLRMICRGSSVVLLDSTLHLMLRKEQGSFVVELY